MGKFSKKNINRKTRKTRKSRKTRKTRKTLKKGGTFNENDKIKIINIAENSIENLHIIYSLTHPTKIDNELNKLNNFLKEIIDLLHNNSNTFISNEQLYDFIRSNYEKYNLKLYHFNDKKKYSTSSLLFMNVLEEEIILMKQMIDLMNKTSCLSPSDSNELDTIKNRFNNISDEFSSKVPCLEQFVTTIYPRVIKPLEDLLQKCDNSNLNNNMENINKSKNNVKEKMSLDDFHYDGDISNYYNPIYELHQNVLLSLISFRKSLCNNNNDCNQNNEQITKAYNENNYKEYLDYIHFFNNEKFKTIGINWEQLKKIFESYLLELPEPTDFINENMCCLNELKDMQQQIIGGKNKKNNKIIKK
jgi:hypothetical protein